MLYQLCSELRRRDLPAYMFFPYLQKGKSPVHANYVKYHVPYVEAVVDKPENILVLPETQSEYYGSVRHIRKIFWWLSVDNYLTHLGELFQFFFTDLTQVNLQRQVYLLTPDAQMEHWVQSEYARQYVQLNQVPERQIYFVGDYLRTSEHLGGTLEHTERQDVIVYNPAKGLEFTQQIMQAAPDLKWQPIKDMTPQQVQAALAQAKVYIDFGNHPGQDRIPREAAVAGCCIITGWRGSAANDIDIPIPQKYKFADKSDSIPAIIACIRECLSAYAVHIADFAEYRQMILGQRAKFRADVAAALPDKAQRQHRQHVVLGRGAHLGALLTALLKEREDLSIDGIWADDSQYTNVECEGHDIPVWSLSDVVFLYREERIQYILLEREEQEKGAMLSQAGIPQQALGWLSW